MTFLQPRYVIDDRVVSGFYPVVVAIDGLVIADLRIIEVVRFLLGDKQFDIIAQRTLITF